MRARARVRQCVRVCVCSYLMGRGLCLVMYVCVMSGHGGGGGGSAADQADVIHTQNVTICVVVVKDLVVCPNPSDRRTARCHHKVF